MKKKILFRICYVLLATLSLNVFAQSDLVITEILYNQPGNDTLEFIELYNKGSQSINMSGYKVTSGFGFVFPDYTLKPGGYVVVARYASFFKETFGLTPLQWDSGGLSNTGEKIVIKTPSGLIADSVEYDNKSPWDKKADGKGSSLVLCDVNADNSFGYFWAASNDIGGIFEDGSVIYASPGEGNSVCNATGDIYPPKVKKVYAPQKNIVKVVFNEPITTTTAQALSNYSGVYVSSAVLSSSKDTVTLNLSVPLAEGVFNTLTISNITDLPGNLLVTQSLSFAFNDTKAPLVITEIMYNNPGADTLEFIEVYNNGPDAANVGGYYFSDGIDFTFPSLVLGGHQYLVICANRDFFNSFFGLSNTYQWDAGSLSNSGEKITIKNSAGIIIDQVDYSNKAPWPLEADGTGPSLIFCDPDNDNNNGVNWSFSENFIQDYVGFPVYASPGAANGICILSLLDQKTFKPEIKIYPNPSFGIFDIECEASNRTYIEIFNALGEIVFAKENTAANAKLDLSTQEKGIYYLRLTNFDKGTFSSSKVIIE